MAKRMVFDSDLDLYLFPYKIEQFGCWSTRREQMCGTEKKGNTQQKNNNKNWDVVR